MLTFLPKLVPLLKALPVILLAGGAAYGVHQYIVSQHKEDISELEQRVTVLTQQNTVLQSAADVNERTIQSLRDRLAQQAQQVVDLTESRQRLIQERDEYLSIFRRHDLTKLSRARPGLIEPRINSGTKDVFRQIEQDSRELHNVQDTDSNTSPQPR
mgnify:CR=1 FL=1